MNALPSIDQKILTSSPFIFSMPDYSICFLIKIQGLCENAFENNHQDTTIPCEKKKKKDQESNFMHHFPVNAYCFKRFVWYFKINAKTKKK